MIWLAFVAVFFVGLMVGFLIGEYVEPWNRLR